MSIQLVVTRAPRREKAAGTIDTYVTVPGQTTRWSDVGGHTLDGMLQAQTNVGQISWVDLSMNIAKGMHYNQTSGAHDRVVVIDADNADGNDIIDALLWLSNEHS